MKLERDVEQHLIRVVRAAGGLTIKAGQDGWPDRIVVLPGGMIAWAELKRKGGTLAPLQQVRAETLRRLGQEVVVLWSEDDVDAWLKSKLPDSG